MSMLRIIWRAATFWRASERRAELKRDLKATYEAHRAKAEHASQDYRLRRDLEAMKDEKDQ